MALFSSSESYLGVDFGTATSKVVELVDKKNKIELVTYAESNLKNLLISPQEGDQAAIDRTADVLKQMIDRAEIESTLAVAALPSGAVFSTVLMLPPIPDSEMENAVRFAAKDIVPVNIDDVVLSWSRVGGEANMATDMNQAKVLEGENKKQEAKKFTQEDDEEKTVAVFITAAPKEIVNRYIAVFEKVQISLLSLELETFSLSRSLLSDRAQPTLIIDFSARATTYHIIDSGTPRVSHSIDFGGYDITKSVAEARHISMNEAEKLKNNFGISLKQDTAVRDHIKELVKKQIIKAKDLVALYEKKESQKIAKTILIGGGANLAGLPEYWARELSMETKIGDPWKELSYPENITKVLQQVGPRFGVAVGLALRSFAHVP